MKEISKIVRAILAGFLAVLFVGCVTGPSLQTGSDAEMTYDGLVRLSRSEFGDAWIKPDIDLAHYNQILVVDPEFEFRAMRDGGGPGSRSREFPLSADDKQGIRAAVDASFREALGSSKYFRFTTEEGPDVINVKVRLLDVVAFVPRDQIEHAAPAVSSGGQATIMIEIHDAMSGEILYRAVDRRATRTTLGGVIGTRSDSWADVRKAARSWGEVTREALDQAHDT